MDEDLRKLVLMCAETENSNPLASGAGAIFCANYELTRTQFFYEYSRHVAQTFAEGSLAFRVANCAMNQLGGAFLEELEGFPLDVFHAFDHGEYLMDGDPPDTIPWQRYTIPQVMEALALEGLPPHT